MKRSSLEIARCPIVKPWVMALETSYHVTERHRHSSVVRLCYSVAISDVTQKASVWLAMLCLMMSGVSGRSFVGTWSSSRVATLGHFLSLDMGRGDT